jgi:hypothetical protein
MPNSVRYTLRFLAIAVAITAVSFAVLHFSSRSVGAASASVNSEDITPLTPCANTACNSDCWADGTHHNPQTSANKKPFNPGGCPTKYGCVTVACP